MSGRDAKKLAEEYLKQQAKIMEKYGQAPKLHGERYREASSRRSVLSKLLALLGVQKKNDPGAALLLVAHCSAGASGNFRRLTASRRSCVDVPK